MPLGHLVPKTAGKVQGEQLGYPHHLRDRGENRTGKYDRWALGLRTYPELKCLRHHIECGRYLMSADGTAGKQDMNLGSVNSPEMLHKGNQSSGWEDTVPGSRALKRYACPVTVSASGEGPP